MKAVIMAGGKGTRLFPLTEGCPKPLCELCGKPVCEYILDLLKIHGCTDAVFTLMYKGEMIEKHFDGRDYKGIRLGFSYEDTPLGTAGCVKKAAGDFDEPFVVISGDALCDFNLSQAMSQHKASGAVATIITKSVANPGEFGIVTSKNGIVTGFAEKPSFIGCLEDCANTGVYILSPEITDYIDDGFCDFACDVFPKILKSSARLCCYEEKGYWCDIGDIKAYKRCQRDMTVGRVNVTLNARKLCDTGYSDSASGGYRNLFPPYYIGKNVTIGENTVIKNGTVISDNVSIGEDCTLDGAILLSGVFVGNDTHLCDCVICRDATLKGSCAVYENAVVGENAEVGKGVVVLPDVKVLPSRRTGDDITLSNDLENSPDGGFKLSDNGFCGETNITATPQLMTRLGSALASAAEGLICVASRGDERSQSFAECIMSGINAAGADCTDCGTSALPELIHKGRLCGAELTVFISVGAKTDIRIAARGGMPLCRRQERSIEGIMNRGGAKKADSASFGKKYGCRDDGVYYTAMLLRLADFNCGFDITLDCADKRLKRLALPAFEKISDKTGDRMIVTIGKNAFEAEIFTEDGGVANSEKLLFITCSSLLEKGETVALPRSVLFDLENMFGEKILRYNACSCDSSDLKARDTGEKQPFLTDGCVLALCALKAAAERNTAFDALCNATPDFALSKAFVGLSHSCVGIMKRLCEKGEANADGVIIASGDGKVLVRSERAGKGLYLYARSARAETAKELCGNVGRLIRRLDGKKKP